MSRSWVIVISRRSFVPIVNATLSSDILLSAFIKMSWRWSLVTIWSAVSVLRTEQDVSDRPEAGAVRLSQSRRAWQRLCCCWMIFSTNSMPIGWLSIIRLVSGNEFGQIFVTDTNRKYLDTILESMQNDFALFKVDNGNVEPLKESEDAKDEWTEYEWSAGCLLRSASWAEAAHDGRSGLSVRGNLWWDRWWRVIHLLYIYVIKCSIFPSLLLCYAVNCCWTEISWSKKLNDFCGCEVVTQIVVH